MSETTQETSAPANPDAGTAVATEYDTMLHAAKAATAEFAKSAPAKAPAASTSLAEESASPADDANSGEKTQGDPSSEASAEDPNILARLLKAKGREAAQKQRDEVESYAAKRRAEADADAERRLREADERARHFEREAEARALRRIEEMTSGEELLSRQANANDPLVKLAKRFEADLKARDERAEAMLREIEALKADAHERDQGIHQARSSIAERNFLSKATEDAFPYARAFWDDDADLLQRAKAVLSDAKAESEKRGESNFYCDDKDVLAFLEAEAKERLTRKRETLAKLLSPVEGDKEPVAKGSGRHGEGPKTRTLSTSAASERRASPKPPAAMTEEEAEVAMRQAAASAFRSK